MSEAVLQRGERAVPARASFVFVIFLGSFLLFLIQPMFGRMILPRFGGAPAVWNTAMLFFQAMLLAGYLYAHLLSRWPLKRQLATHLALFALAAATLPIGLAGFYPDSGGVGSGALADRPAHRLDRPGLLRRRRPGAADAGLVRAQRRRASAQSLFPLRRQQCRQPARARLLSACWSSRCCRSPTSPGSGRAASRRWR